MGTEDPDENLTTTSEVASLRSALTENAPLPSIKSPQLPRTIGVGHSQPMNIPNPPYPGWGASDSRTGESDTRESHTMSLASPTTLLNNTRHIFYTFEEVVLLSYFSINHLLNGSQQATWHHWLSYLGIATEPYMSAILPDSNNAPKVAVEKLWMEELSDKRRLIEFFVACAKFPGTTLTIHDIPSRESPTRIHELCLADVSALWNYLRIKDEKFEMKDKARLIDPPQISWYRLEKDYKIYHADTFIVREEYEATRSTWLEHLGVNFWPFCYSPDFQEGALAGPLPTFEVEWSDLGPLQTESIIKAMTLKQHNLEEPEWCSLETYYGFFDEVGRFNGPNYKTKKGLWLKQIGIGEDDSSYVHHAEVSERWESKSVTERKVIAEKALEERKVYCIWRRSVLVGATPTGQKPVTILDETGNI